MRFLSSLKKNITGTARDVKRKSEDMVEITKLSLSIGSDEEKLKKLLYELGAGVYKSYCGSLEDDHSDLKCAEILKLEEVITGNKEKILILRGSAECKECGAVVDADSNFCAKCGAKIDPPKPPTIIENQDDYGSIEKEEP